MNFIWKDDDIYSKKTRNDMTNDIRRKIYDYSREITEREKETEKKNFEIAQSIIDSSMSKIDSEFLEKRKEAYDFFIQYPSLVNEKMFDFILENRPDDQILNLFLQMLAKILKNRDDLIKIFIQKGFFPYLTNFFSSTNEVLICSSLKIIKKIVNSSFDSAALIIESGIFQYNEPLINMISEIPINGPEDHFRHEMLFLSIFDMLGSFLKYPQLFIIEYLKIYGNILTVIPNLIFNELYVNYKTHELLKSLNFIHRLYACIPFIKECIDTVFLSDSKTFNENQIENEITCVNEINDANNNCKDSDFDQSELYNAFMFMMNDMFNNINIFDWIIDKLLYNDEQVQISACDALIGITYGDDLFGKTLLTNTRLIENLKKLDTNNEKNLVYITIIFQNLSASKDLEIPRLIFANKEIIDFIMNIISTGNYLCKYRAVISITNLVLVLEGGMKDFFLQHLEFLATLVEIIPGCQNFELLINVLAGINTILMIGERFCIQKFANVFINENIIEYLDNINIEDDVNHYLLERYVGDIKQILQEHCVESQ